MGPRIREGVKVGMVPLNITPSDPLTKCLLPLPTTLCSVGLEIAPEGGRLVPGSTIVPLNRKPRIPPVHFVLLMPLRKHAKKGVTVLSGVIDPDYQRKIGLLLHNGRKEEYTWSTSDPLGCLLVLPYPVIKVNEKLQ